MENERTKQDYELMRQYTASTSIDINMSYHGREQLDASIENTRRLNEYLDKKQMLKQKLAELLKTAKTQGTTLELKQNINEVLLEIKNLKVPEQIKTETIKTQNIDGTYQDMVKSDIEFARVYNVDLSNPYVGALSNMDQHLLENELIDKFELLRIDEYDRAFSAAAGLFCGAIDAICVGTATKDITNMGFLAKKTDQMYGGMVKTYAKMCGWSGAQNGSDPLKSAIGFLEREFPVSYDQRTVDQVGKAFQGIRPENHHLLSLAHSPLGLIFGIWDLLENKASFINPETGKILRIDGSWSKRALDNGQNQIQSVVEAVGRWFSHLVSDVAGSSGGSGRGMGLPTGVQTILQSFQIGKIPLGNGSYETIAGTVQKMYENGFDFRFSTATAIPVIILEVLIRTYWGLKQRFYYGKTLEESKPFGNKRELQRLLLIGTLTFSTTDATHALVKGYFCGNPITTLNSLNYVGLANLAGKLVTNFKNEMKHNKKVKSVLEGEVREKHLELIKNT